MFFPCYFTFFGLVIMAEIIDGYGVRTLSLYNVYGQKYSEILENRYFTRLS